MQSLIQKWNKAMHFSFNVTNAFKFVIFKYINILLFVTKILMKAWISLMDLFKAANIHKKWKFGYFYENF